MSQSFDRNGNAKPFRLHGATDRSVLDGAALATALLSTLLLKPRTRRTPTQEEIAEQDKNTERQLWNAAVDERNRAKQLDKKGYAK